MEQPFKTEVCDPIVYDYGTPHFIKIRRPMTANKARTMASLTAVESLEWIAVVVILQNVLKYAAIRVTAYQPLLFLISLLGQLTLPPLFLQYI